MEVTKLAEQLAARGSTISVRWVPGHQGFDGNEQADQKAREAAREGSEKVHSLAFLKRFVTERATQK